MNPRQHHQNQNHPKSSELFVDFYKFRKKYPTDVLLIGVYEIAKNKQDMFVFVKNDDEEPEEKWYKECLKSTHERPIPYHRLIRVKGCRFLYELESRAIRHPIRFSYISRGLSERVCYAAYYIAKYHGDDIIVLDGESFLNNDSFEYLKSIINSLREYDISGGGLTTRDIEYCPQHPIELIKKDETGVIISGMESVIEAYYMSEITLLGIFPYFGRGQKSTEEEEEGEGKKKKKEKERILVCCVTNEDDGDATLDEVLEPSQWIIERVNTDVSDYLKIKCDDFIDSLLSSHDISFKDECHIYSCTWNFEYIQRMNICQCLPHLHRCVSLYRKLKDKLSLCKTRHKNQLSRQLKRKMTNDLKNKKRFKKGK